MKRWSQEWFGHEGFYVVQNNNPDNPALIGEVLGAVGVNIEGLCLTTCEERTVIHFVVEDAVTARQNRRNSIDNQFHIHQRRHADFSCRINLFTGVEKG